MNGSATSTRMGMPPDSRLSPRLEAGTVRPAGRGLGAAQEDAQEDTT